MVKWFMFLSEIWVVKWFMFLPGACVVKWFMFLFEFGGEVVYLEPGWSSGLCSYLESG